MLCRQIFFSIHFDVTRCTVSDCYPLCFDLLTYRLFDLRFKTETRLQLGFARTFFSIKFRITGFFVVVNPPGMVKITSAAFRLIVNGSMD